MTTNANAFAGNPAVIGSLKPLDRKLCAPGFYRVCPLVEMKLKAAARVGNVSVCTDVCTGRQLTSVCDDSLRGSYTHANAFWTPGQAQYHVSCYILRGRCQLLLTKGVGARELHERAPAVCSLDDLLTALETSGLGAHVDMKFRTPSAAWKTGARWEVDAVAAVASAKRR